MVLVLRAIGLSQEETGAAAKCDKATVGQIENWVREAPYGDVAKLCDDEATRSLVSREFAYIGLSNEDLIKAVRITGDEVLRYHRKDYLSRKREKRIDLLTLKHMEDLAVLARKMAPDCDLPDMYPIRPNVGLPDIPSDIDGLQALSYYIWGPRHIGECPHMDYGLYPNLRAHLQAEETNWEARIANVRREVVCIWDTLRSLAQKEVFKKALSEFANAYKVPNVVLLTDLGQLLFVASFEAGQDKLRLLTQVSIGFGELGNKWPEVQAALDAQRQAKEALPAIKNKLELVSRRRKFYGRCDACP